MIRNCVRLLVPKTGVKIVVHLFEDRFAERYFLNVYFQSKNFDPKH